MQPAPRQPALPAAPNAAGERPPTGVMAPEGLATLLAVLRAQGYRVLGPTVRDGAVIYDEVHALDELPVGWTDEQAGGSYRLKRQDEDTLFGYAVGPHAWKQFLFPSRRRLWSATRAADGAFDVVPEPEAAPPTAFLGVRGCDLAALAVQDRVFMEGAYQDPVYAARRRQTLIIAVNCAHAADTCFCTSMGTGPHVRAGYDLALTEVAGADRHWLLVEAGTEAGRALLARLPVRPADEADRAEARQVVDRTAASIHRTMDTTDLRDLLLDQPDHPRWDDVAARCLSCTNCTAVCPTCFCHTVEDVTDLGGQTAERWQRWDSCFTMDFSYLHGGSVRPTTHARYRQWLTHKLAGWIDQFGTSGCVGCGRCITWCPVGIDLTEEVRALRQPAPALPAASPASASPAP